MSLAKFYEVKEFHSAPRGTMHELHFKGRDRILVVRRRKGSISGCHCHKGLTPSKSPEIFFIISGSFEVALRDTRTGQEEKRTAAPNTAIEIPPFIYHEFRALEDSAFLELGFKGDDYESDTVREEQPR